MKSRATLKSVILETICLFYVLLFVYAAVSKLLDFENFQIQLGQSPLLSAFAGYIVWIVPLLELLIALLLLVKRVRLLGLFGAFSMMVMFTAYIYIILNYSSFIPCSCGGILEKMGWQEHLLFNVFFVVLAVIGILILAKTDSAGSVLKPRLVNLSLIASSSISIGIVTLFFILSETIIHHRNNFVRRYSGSATKVNEIDLNFTSYYFAGTTKETIYLGNYTAPLLVTKLDTSLKKKSEFKIQPNRTDFRFQSVQVRVLPPNFYLIDGTVPVIFKGTINDWRAWVKWEGSTSFSHFQLIDSLTLAVRSNNTIQGESQLGFLHFGDNSKFYFNPRLLEKQIDGIFDVDGALHFDKYIQKLVYVYFYRNQFIVADQRLNLNYRGNTIDTISKAQIKVTMVESRNEIKLAAPPVVVNKTSAVYRNLLFVNAALLGKYEPKEMWDDSSIIDVYDFTTKTYQGSFYIYDIENEKLKNFIVLDDNFYGFVGRHLVHYKLSKSLVKAYKN